jgi:isopentenyl diphosphate isomerase/L-lactate dehydrogenase-like FMN-dependent dehydrogenase
MARMDAVAGVAVAFGRPALWSLAVGGKDATAAVLRAVVDGPRRTLVLLGQSCFAAVGGRAVVRR